MLIPAKKQNSYFFLLPATLSHSLSYAAVPSSRAPGHKKRCCAADCQAALSHSGHHCLTTEKRRGTLPAWSEPLQSLVATLSSSPSLSPYKRCAGETAFLETGIRPWRFFQAQILNSGFSVENAECLPTFADRPHRKPRRRKGYSTLQQGELFRADSELGTHGLA